jgi:hypothetical protein
MDTVNVLGQEIEFNALTCIDTVTNLVELCQIDNKNADYIRMHFENEWLAQYPRPLYCVHGLIIVANLLDKDSNKFWNVSTSRMYLQHWRTLKPMQFVNKWIKQLETLWGPYYAMHIHLKIFIKLRILLIQPLLLLLMQQEQPFIKQWKTWWLDWYFTHQDMFLDIPLLANLATICQNRQQLSNENLPWDNLKWRSQDYQPGQEVLLLIPDPKILEPRAIWSFPVHQVHTNGMISILWNPHVLEWINIWQVWPYCQLH